MISDAEGTPIYVRRMDGVPKRNFDEGSLLLRREGSLVGAFSASGARGAEDAQAVRAGMTAIAIEP